MLHQVDVSNLAEFYYPPQNSLTSPDLWQDPVKSLQYVTDLLEQANKKMRAAKMGDSDMADEISNLKKQKDYKQNLTTDYAEYLLGISNHGYQLMPEDKTLWDKIGDAAQNTNELAIAIDDQKNFNQELFYQIRPARNIIPPSPLLVYRQIPGPHSVPALALPRP